MTSLPPLARTSVSPGVALDETPGAALSRRRFIQAAVASAAVGLSVPVWMREAWAAPQLAPSDGILVVVTLRGGYDPLSVLVPRQGERRTRYEAARGQIAVPADGLLPITDEFGLDPKLPGLAKRYAAGNVALVQGVGLARSTRSHFAATKLLQSAIEGQYGTGWLGRHIDELEASGGGVSGVTLTPTVPLHMQGRRHGTVALPLGSTLWGSDTSKSYERSAFDAMRSFAAEPTGLGEWGDATARMAAMAIDEATVVGPLAKAAPANANQLARALQTAALAINADIGTRVVAAETSGYDTHANQPHALAAGLAQLDAAIELFFTTLEGARRPQVAVLIVSEFGRTVAANSSHGTDHGNAGMSILIGDNVRGGLHGAHPSLVDLDPSGSLIPNVDHREVYATVIEQWLAGDANAILGGTFSHLDLFAAAPGSTA